MRIKNLLAVATTLAIFPFAAQAQEACEADERLYAMNDFAEAQRAGNADPLRLTTDTYLHLTPKAREVIGDNLLLLDANCKPMQLMDGEPALKVEAPFAVLYRALEDAVLRGDERTARIVVNTFKAQSVDPVAYASFIAAPSQDPELLQRLANAAGITPHQAIGSKCEEDSTYILYADIFSRLGGEVEGHEHQAWFAIGSEPEVTSVQDPEYTQKYSSLPGNCHISKRSIVSLATAAGAVTVDLGNHWADYWGKGDHRSNTIEAYNEWVEAGAPEDVKPKSLFD